MLVPPSYAIQRTGSCWEWVWLHRMQPLKYISATVKQASMLIFRPDCCLMLTTHIFHSKYRLVSRLFWCNNENIFLPLWSSQHANVQMCNYNILRAILKWSRHGALVNKQTKGRPLPAKIYEIFGETSKSGKIPKKRGGGGQRLFGVSPKIHPFWWAEASLREDWANQIEFSISSNQMNPEECSIPFKV